jgi:LuxR family maltose regulon positive regulatory protein
LPASWVELGFAHLLAGDEARAEAALATAVDVAVAAGASVGAAMSLAGLSLQATARGELDRSGKHLHRATEIIAGARLAHHLANAAVQAAAGRLALAHGGRTAAHDAVETAEPILPQLTYAIPWLAVYVRLELAHIRLALGDPARARVLLEEMEQIAAHRPSLGVLGERVTALRHDLDVGRSADDGWVSPLTPAELRLLPLLASYLSFREISEQLGISRNTVKTQAIAVYRKLEVSSRSEAVTRARELGLLREPV